MAAYITLLCGMSDEDDKDKHIPDQLTGDDIPKQTDEDETTLPDVDKEVKSVTESLQDISQRVLFAESLEKHKTNPTALIYLGRKQSYFTSTVSSTESMSTAEISYSVENIITDAAEQIKEWIGKALATVKKSILAVKAKLGFAAHGVSETGEVAIARAGDQSTLMDKVKAHPYVTVAACVAACVALAAIVPMFAGVIPTTMSEEAGAAGLARLAQAVKSIKWPFGSFSLKTAKDGISVAYTATKNTFTAMRTAPIETVKNLGWTQSLIKTVTSQAAKVAKTFPKLSELVVSQFKKEVDLVASISKQPTFLKKLKTTGAAAFRITTYLPFVKMGWSVVAAVFGLIKDIVLGTFRIIKHTFNALAGRGKKVDQDAESTTDTDMEGVPA